MRYNSPSIPVPYFTPSEGPGELAWDRTHSYFRFTGDVDKRRVRRTIRKMFKRIGLHTPKFYIDHYVKVATRK